MPMPLSATASSTQSRPSATWRTRSATSPSFVNLQALLKRLSRICLSRMESAASAPKFSCVSTTRRFWFFSASCPAVPMTSSISRVKFTGSGLSSSLPASIFERSSTSLMRLRRWVPAAFTRRSGSSAFSVPKRVALATIISVRPMIALSGVRSSWLMLERNCDLFSLAICNWRLLSSISRNRRAFWIASTDWAANVCRELNGFFAKFAPLLAPNHERPDDALCADQRHDEARPKSGPHRDLSDRAWRLVADICDLQWLSVLDRPAERIGSTGWLASDCRNQLIAQAIRRPHSQGLIQLIKDIDHPRIRIRKLDRLGHDRGQHGLQIEGGVDRLADLAKRLQLFDRLCEFARARLHLLEQPHVLDRDNRLIRARGDQLDLLIGKGPHRIPR